MDFLYFLIVLLFGVVLGYILGKAIATRESSGVLAENRLLREQLSEKASGEQKLKETFEVIANSVLVGSVKNLTFEAQSNIKNLLDPLQNSLGEFRTRLEQLTQNQVREAGALQKQLETLMQLNQNLSQEAKRLTDALRGDVKKQGSWGEIQLERILEASGLKKGIEYKLQVSSKNEEDKLQRPDAIIYLPEKRHVVIDAKVSLSSYQKLFDENADIKKAKEELLESVRNHIKSLEKRDYTHLHEINSPDFVFLFIPIEGALLTVLGEDPSIYEEAYRKKIILLGPSTLLAALKLVHYIWRQDEQNKNALEIAKQGATLYDKFCDFLKDMENIKTSLVRAQEAYDLAAKKLSEGRGNLISQAEKLKELGITPKKSLPSSFVE